MRKTFLTIAVTAALSGAATYLATSWCTQTGLFEANTIRDGKLQAGAVHPWAKPLSVKGVENLHQVSTNLYRGEQPSSAGYAGLKNLGIKTVINLRSEDDEGGLVRQAGLEYRHISMVAYRKPRDEQVVAFLKIVNNPANWPIFVHCQRGSDRTGTMCAVYRVFVEGWTRDEAIQEMTRGGFGYHSSFGDLTKYLREMDIERIRRQSGVGGR